MRLRLSLDEITALSMRLRLSAEDITVSVDEPGSWGQALDPLVHNKGHDVPLLIRDHLITGYAKTSKRT